MLFRFKFWFKSWTFFSSLCAIALSLPSAQARLGETASSGKKISTLHPDGKKYVIHLIKTADGLTLSEYAIPDNGTPNANLVFGVAWQDAKILPEPQHILGERYQRNFETERKRQIMSRKSALKDPWNFSHAAAKRAQGTNHAQTITNEVVIESWGSMRNLGGRAYSPTLLESIPNLGGIWGFTANDLVGVDANEIK